MSAAPFDFQTQHLLVCLRRFWVMAHMMPFVDVTILLLNGR
jgi:hypothetical protein